MSQKRPFLRQPACCAALDPGAQQGVLCRGLADALRGPSQDPRRVTTPATPRSLADRTPSCLSRGTSSRGGLQRDYLGRPTTVTALMPPASPAQLPPAGTPRGHTAHRSRTCGADRQRLGGHASGRHAGATEPSTIEASYHRRPRASSLVTSRRRVHPQPGQGRTSVGTGRVQEPQIRIVMDGSLAPPPGAVNSRMRARNGARCPSSLPLRLPGRVRASGACGLSCTVATSGA